jgi:hypothetical protein
MRQHDTFNVPVPCWRDFGTMLTIFSIGLLAGLALSEFWPIGLPEAGGVVAVAGRPNTCPALEPIAVEAAPVRQKLPNSV